MATTASHTMHDRKWMARALQLAANGEGKTSFRPLVGCVLVKNGRVIAQAEPHETGLPHVEALALAKAGEKAKGATAYVTLEPCAWHAEKKAPACCEALVRAGVKRVVCAGRDPHPKINGRGVAFLKRSGVQVSVGVLREQAEELNEAWAKYCTTGMPFVVLKMACTIDGVIWAPRMKSISNEEERVYTHRLRNKYQAILVGAGTVEKDNPRLTCRLPGGRDPLRVIFDSRLRLPVNARVFADSNAVVFTTSNAAREKKRVLESKGVRVLVAEKNGRVDARQALKRLGEMRIASVMVEGGSRVATAFLNQHLVDKVVIAVAPALVGSGVRVVGEELGEVVNLSKVRMTVVSDNVIFSGYPENGKSGWAWKGLNWTR